MKIDTLKISFGITNLVYKITILFNDHINVGVD